MIDRCFNHAKQPIDLQVLWSKLLARTPIAVAYGDYLAENIKRVRWLMHPAVALHQPSVFKKMFWSVYLKTWLNPRLSHWLRELRRVILQQRVGLKNSGNDAEQ